MNFIALKPCCFAGRNFKIGETIPGEFILPEMQKRLIKMGKIAATPDAQNEPSEPRKMKKQAVKNGGLDI